MPRITQFNKLVLRNLRPVLEDAIAQVGRDFGFTAEVGNASFSANEVTFKLRLTLNDASGRPIDMDAEHYKQNCRLIGLPAELLDREFEFNGKRYALKGMDLNSRKYPLLGIPLRTGRVYQFEVSAIKRAFGIRSSMPQLLVSQPEVTEIGFGDIADVRSVLGEVLSTVSPGEGGTPPKNSDKRPYKAFVEDLLNQSAYDRQGIISRVMRDFPETSITSLKSFMTDLKNPKYSAFKPRYVQELSGGRLAFIN